MHRLLLSYLPNPSIENREKKKKGRKNKTKQVEKQGEAALPQESPVFSQAAWGELLPHRLICSPPFIEIICTSKSLNKAAAPGGREQAGGTRDLG